jgi:hypothetical protein
MAYQHARKLLYPQGRSPMSGTMTHRPQRRTVRRYGRTRALSFPPSICPIRLAELNTHCYRNKARPMPELVVAPSGSGSTRNIVPPASAFQAPVRILKRSLVPAQNLTNAGPSASTTTETFAEKSARYNAARERIFSDTIEGKVKVVGGEGGVASLVVRNPKGPAPHSPGPNGGGREGSHGFAERTATRRGDSSTVEQEDIP